jgi:hypothetical protein
VISEKKIASQRIHFKIKGKLVATSWTCPADLSCQPAPMSSVVEVSYPGPGAKATTVKRTNFHNKNRVTRNRTSCQAGKMLWCTRTGLCPPFECTIFVVAVWDCKQCLVNRCQLLVLVIGRVNVWEAEARNVRCEHADKSPKTALEQPQEIISSHRQEMTLHRELYSTVFYPL